MFSEKVGRENTEKVTILGLEFLCQDQIICTQTGACGFQVSFSSVSIIRVLFSWLGLGRNCWVSSVSQKMSISLYKPLPNFTEQEFSPPYDWSLSKKKNTVFYDVLSTILCFFFYDVLLTILCLLELLDISSFYSNEIKALIFFA